MSATEVPIPSPPPAVPKPKEKLSVKADVLCGWPLFLLGIGGAVGGGLGGAAYGINVVLYKSRLPLTMKILLNIQVGILAIVLWVLIVHGISSVTR